MTSCYAKEMRLLYLILVSTLILSHQSMAKDRVFIESYCTMQGLQELILKDNGEFTLTTYLNRKTPLKTELKGSWSLKSQKLRLKNEEIELLFIVSNKPIEISGQHLLVSYMEPVKGLSEHSLNECEFTDKRILERIIKSK